MKLNLLLLFLFSFSNIALAKDFPVQARLFAGAVQADPKDVNTELEAQSLRTIDSVLQYGFEATYPVAKALSIGLRYNRRNLVRDEDDSSPVTDYQAELDQNSVSAIARIPLLKTNIVRFDIFGGVGGSNTTLKIKTATQDGEISRKEGGDWFATPITSYGGSLAIGYKKFYFVIEGGMESNKVGGLKRTGTVNTNIESIDLSGYYFTFGLLFDGMTASKK